MYEIADTSPTLGAKPSASDNPALCFQKPSTRVENQVDIITASTGSTEVEEKIRAFINGTPPNTNDEGEANLFQLWQKAKSMRTVFSFQSYEQQDLENMATLVNAEIERRWDNSNLQGIKTIQEWYPEPSVSFLGTLLLAWGAASQFLTRPFLQAANSNSQSLPPNTDGSLAKSITDDTLSNPAIITNGTNNGTRTFDMEMVTKTPPGEFSLTSMFQRGFGPSVFSYIAFTVSSHEDLSRLFQTGHSGQSYPIWDNRLPWQQITRCDTTDPKNWKCTIRYDGGSAILCLTDMAANFVSFGTLENVTFSNIQVRSRYGQNDLKNQVVMIHKENYPALTHSYPEKVFCNQTIFDLTDHFDDNAQHFSATITDKNGTSYPNAMAIVPADEPCPPDVRNMTLKIDPNKLHGDGKYIITISARTDCRDLKKNVDFTYIVSKCAVTFPPKPNLPIGIKSAPLFPHDATPVTFDDLTAEDARNIEISNAVLTVNGATYPLGKFPMTTKALNAALSKITVDTSQDPDGTTFPVTLDVTANGKTYQNTTHYVVDIPVVPFAQPKVIGDFNACVLNQFETEFETEKGATLQVAVLAGHPNNLHVTPLNPDKTRWKVTYQSDKQEQVTLSYQATGSTQPASEKFEQTFETTPMQVLQHETQNCHEEVPFNQFHLQTPSANQSFDLTISNAENGQRYFEGTGNMAALQTALNDTEGLLAPGQNTTLRFQFSHTCEKINATAQTAIDQAIEVAPADQVSYTLAHAHQAQDGSIHLPIQADRIPGLAIEVTGLPEGVTFDAETQELVFDSTERYCAFGGDVETLGKIAYEKPGDSMVTNCSNTVFALNFPQDLCQSLEQQTSMLPWIIGAVATMTAFGAGYLARQKCRESKTEDAPWHLLEEASSPRLEEGQPSAPREAHGHFCREKTSAFFCPSPKKPEMGVEQTDGPLLVSTTNIAGRKLFPSFGGVAGEA